MENNLHAATANVEECPNEQIQIKGSHVQASRRQTDQAMRQCGIALRKLFLNTKALLKNNAIFLCIFSRRRFFCIRGWSRKPLQFATKPRGRLRAARERDSVSAHRLTVELAKRSANDERTVDPLTYRPPPNSNAPRNAEKIDPTLTSSWLLETLGKTLLVFFSSCSDSVCSLRW